MIEERKIEFINSNDEKIRGYIIYNSNNIYPSVLYLNGGGNSNGQYGKYLTDFLIENNISSVRFDFTGQGESEGLLCKSSLKKRVFEALQACKYLSDGPITLIGSSMGGHIAIELLKHKSNIKNIVLFAPALYSAESYDVEFDNGFTELIRKERSYEATDLLQVLNNFKGNFLHIIGEKDEVIPTGVTELYKDNISKVANSKFVEIKGCPHKINIWLSEYPNERKEIQELVYNFIK